MSLEKIDLPVGGAVVGKIVLKTKMLHGKRYGAARAWVKSPFAAESVEAIAVIAGERQRIDVLEGCVAFLHENGLSSSEARRLIRAALRRQYLESEYVRLRVARATCALDGRPGASLTAELAALLENLIGEIASGLSDSELKAGVAALEQAALEQAELEATE